MEQSHAPPASSPGPGHPPVFLGGGARLSHERLFLPMNPPRTYMPVYRYMDKIKELVVTVQVVRADSGAEKVQWLGGGGSIRRQ